MPTIPVHTPIPSKRIGDPAAKAEVLTALGLTFAVKSDVGQAGGGTRINNIVRITTADYNAIPVPDPDTFYWIVDP